LFFLHCSFLLSLFFLFFFPFFTLLSFILSFFHSSFLLPLFIPFFTLLSFLLSFFPSFLLLLFFPFSFPSFTLLTFLLPFLTFAFHALVFPSGNAFSSYSFYQTSARNFVQTLARRSCKGHLCYVFFIFLNFILFKILNKNEYKFCRSEERRVAQ